MGSLMFDLFIRILEWEVSPCHPFFVDLSINLPYKRDKRGIGRLKWKMTFEENRGG